MSETDRDLIARLGRESFGQAKEGVTKAHLARESRRLLTYPAGTVLAESADLAVVEQLLMLHPSRDTKIGPGIDHWKIGRNPLGRGGELRIVRVDGTEVDFSYRRALAPDTPATNRADLHAALRYEVREQIISWRQKQTRAICAVSDLPLATDSAHVDHAPPWTFAALADAWLEHHPQVSLASADYGQRIADRALAADWQSFHRWSCRLRLVHRDINAAIAKVRRDNAA